MASKNVTPQAAPDTSQLDIYDQMTMKLHQAEALIVLIAGEGGDAFEAMNRTLRAGYLSTCSTLIQDAHELALKLQPAMEASHE
ncbi:hypothetical protein DBA29_03595 [Xenophilus aerolatus]|nr:hypothetical protein [Xenophilus aerolatus]